MSDEVTSSCDLCGGPNGDIWCKSSGGRGTPLCYGHSAMICELCYKTREADVEELRRVKMAESLKHSQESLNRQINERDMSSGMVYHAFQYWFSRGFESLEKYEEYLGFKLADWFKGWITNLKCYWCAKHIRLQTEDELKTIFEIRGLPEPYERPEVLTKEEKEAMDGATEAEMSALWDEKYEAAKPKIEKYEADARKWRAAFTILYHTHYYTKPFPEFPPNLGDVSISKLHDYPEYMAYKKLYDEYKASEIRCQFCSEDCQKAYRELHPEAVGVMY